MHRDKWAWAILIIVTGLWATVVGWLAIQRLLAFHATGDLADLVQAIWTTAHGRPFYISLMGGQDNFLGHHFAPLLAVLAPVYRLWPDLRVLLVAQTIGLALAVIPLYRFAEQRLGPNSGLLVALAYLLFPALSHVALFDVHEIGFAVPLLMAAGAALLDGRLRRCTIWLVMAMLVKEDVGLIAAGFGLYAALVMRRWRYGLILAALSLAWVLLLVLVIMPALHQGNPYAYLSRYASLGNTPAEMLRTLLLHPATVYRVVARPEKLLFTAQLFAPLAGLPLLGFPAILLALPTYAYLLLSDDVHMTSLEFHYTAPLIPFFFLATVVALNRLRRRRASVYHGATVALLVAALVTARLWSLLPGGLAYTPDNYRVTEADREARALLATIPPDASVGADGEYASWVANRFRMSGLRAPPDDEVGPSRVIEYRAVRKPAPYAIAAPAYPWVVRNEPGSPVRMPRYDLIKEVPQGLALWKWRGPEQDVVLQRYDEPFDRGLNLVAAGLTPEGPAWGPVIEARSGTTLPLWLVWQATRPLDRRITFSVHLVDTRDRGVAQVDREMGGGRFPTTMWYLWHKDPTIAGEFPLDLPPDVSPGRYRLLVGAFETETVAALSRPNGSQWVEAAQIEIKP